MFHGLRAYCRRYNSAMTTANDQPVEKLKFPMADAELYVGEKLKYNCTMIPADRLFVQHYTGNQDDALIFEQHGKRLAMNIRMIMNLEAPSSGGPLWVRRFQARGDRSRRRKAATSNVRPFREANDHLSPFALFASLSCLRAAGIEW
jgi:hypothetical protein